MRKPKVQLHLPNLYVGGIERWALTLLNGTPEFDWRISTPPGAVTHQSGLNEFRKFAVIQECDPSFEPDVLVATWGTSNRSVVPTIAVAHSAFPKYQAMMQSVRYDFAVAVSQEARCCFPNGAEVDVIYNGVDTARLQAREPRTSVRARLGIAERAHVIGYVGRWGYQKNPLAAARAASLIPGAVALYIGPAPDDRAMVDEANRLCECHFVRPEEVGNIGDLYAAMDVGVFASRTEGFGLAIAEAWYCRVPVVATSVGVAAEHPDLVRQLPDEPSPEDLKRAVERALLDRDEGMLQRARETVLTLYSAERMTRDWRAYIVAHLS